MSRFPWSVLFSKKIDFHVFQGNQFHAKKQQNCRHRFHICSSNYVKLINTTLLIKHRGGCGRSKRSRALMQIKCYTAVWAGKFMNQTVCISKSHQHSGLFIYQYMSPNGLLWVKGHAMIWQIKQIHMSCSFSEACPCSLICLSLSVGLDVFPDKIKYSLRLDNNLNWFNYQHYNICQFNHHFKLISNK